mmetsp:Transcript_10780/g.19663  ORF Transcript_10780/g.19663 Transcript_10780/m.19663 type:complete len:97 (-) Transcript_10780:84-374(-)
MVEEAWLDVEDVVVLPSNSHIRIPVVEGAELDVVAMSTLIRLVAVVVVVIASSSNTSSLIGVVGVVGVVAVVDRVLFRLSKVAFRLVVLNCYETIY